MLEHVTPRKTVMGSDVYARVQGALMPCTLKELSGELVPAFLPIEGETTPYGNPIEYLCHVAANDEPPYRPKEPA